MHHNYYTTIEQSKKLLSLGVGRETADMAYFYWKNSHTKESGIDDVPTILNKLPIEDADVPCWSLGALFDLLPHRITGFDGIEYHRVTRGNILEYATDTSSHNRALISIPSNQLMSPAYQMLVWLLENDYIKTKE